jgi:hypothetical protein
MKIDVRQLFLLSMCGPNIWDNFNVTSNVDLVMGEVLQLEQEVELMEKIRRL